MIDIDESKNKLHMEGTAGDLIVELSAAVATVINGNKEEDAQRAVQSTFLNSLLQAIYFKPDHTTKEMAQGFKNMKEDFNEFFTFSKLLTSNMEDGKTIEETVKEIATDVPEGGTEDE